MREIQRMKHRLLLVDDQEGSLTRSFRNLFPSESWEVALAANAKQAIEKSHAGETDLLVMALDSRTADGWRAIDEITEVNPFMRVVVITKQPDLRDLAEAVGARALVEQPVDVPTLLQTMQELLGKPKEKGMRGARSQDMSLRHVPASSQSFREILQQRYTAPYALTSSHRDWGINE